jgi:hydrogenase maturation protease
MDYCTQTEVGKAKRRLSTSANILVIGYGNLLRSDDAVGQQIAEAVAAWKIPHVQAIALHQLTPELAEQLAGVEMVIFVDVYPASTAEQGVQVRPLQIGNSRFTTGHWCEPPLLLAITQSLYGSHPQAWWVVVPGTDFELGQNCSATAKQGMPIALQSIQQLIQIAREKTCMNLA